jgi:hypothetical protein
MARLLPFLVLVVLVNICCGDSHGDVKNPTNDSSKQASAPTDSLPPEPIHTTDSVLARTLDSVPALKPVADPTLATDSIPVRTPDGKPARYGIRSGRLVGRFTGQARGTRTVIFDRYGLRERREENIAPYPETTAVAISNIIFITTPEFQAYGDIRTKGGFRRDVDALAPYLSSPESKKISLGEYTVVRSGATRLADTTVAGYHCRVYVRHADESVTTIWVWRGITLRQRVEFPAKHVVYTMEPVEVVVDVDVGEGTFEFPSEYKISPYTPPNPR